MDAAYAVGLLRRGELADLGIGERALTRMLKAGELRAVRSGVFVFGEATDGFTEAQRTIVRARALALVSHGEPMFCSLTAAALLGMPIYGEHPRRLHVIVPAQRPSGGREIVRHSDEGVPIAPVRHLGLLVTDPIRTAADLARTMPLDTAVCVADAALARSELAGGDAEQTRAACLEMASKMYRGRAKAERALSFASPLAESPGESVSRIRLHQIGFAPPRMQVEVAGPHGRTFRIDFGLDDIPAWGEFDGRSKYRQSALVNGQDAARVLDAEKQREDWIRGTTGRPLVRWMWEHLKTPAALAARLAAFGVRPR